MPGAMTSAGFERIEVVPSVQRRRQWSIDEELRAVEGSIILGMTVWKTMKVEILKEAIEVSRGRSAKRELSHGGLLGACADAFPVKIPMVQGTPVL